MVEPGSSVIAVLKWLKPAPPLFVAVVLATGFILFGPCLPVGSQQPLPNLCAPIATLRLDYDPWIAISFLLSTALAVSTLTPIACSRLKPAVTRSVQLRHGRQYLRGLTHAEKSILAAYINGQIRALHLFPDDPQLAGLIQTGVLQQSGTRSGRAVGFNIQPWAWKYLSARPHLLEPELSDIRRLAIQVNASPEPPVT